LNPPGFVVEVNPGTVPAGQIVGDFVVMGRARLDDRARLCAELALSKDAHEGDDVRLVGEAWNRWGIDACDRLLGDWVVVVTERRSGHVWVARDACGNSACYYWSDGRRLRVATSLPALCEDTTLPRQPNAAWIAQRLLGRFDTALVSHTAFLGMHQLPGGSVLLWRNGGVTTKRWWYPEHLPAFESRRQDEWIEEGRHLLEQAVVDRMRGASSPIALLLSGGLDSGVVAACAAPEARRAHTRLLGLTSIPEFPADGAGRSRIGNEAHLAQATAQFIGGIDWQPSRATGASVVRSIADKLAIHGQPGHAGGNAYWLLDLCRLARAEGATVLLTGHMGNATISWAGRWEGMLVSALKRVRALARGRPGAQGPDWWRATSAMGQPLARMAAISASASPIEEADFRSLRFATDVQASWAELGAAFGLCVRDPTADRRLVEFCWRLPNRLYLDGGRRRGLVRRGFRGRLPDAVIDNRTKGLQAADVGHRIRQDQQECHAALDAIAVHPLAGEWLDVARMRAVLAEVLHDVSPATTSRAQTILLRGLGVGQFLRTL